MCTTLGYITFKLHDALTTSKYTHMHHFVLASPRVIISSEVLILEEYGENIVEDPGRNILKDPGRKILQFSGRKIVKTPEEISSKISEERSSKNPAERTRKKYP